jgi:hypothetical protein
MFPLPTSLRLPRILIRAKHELKGGTEQSPPGRIFTGEASHPQRGGKTGILTPCRYFSWNLTVTVKMTGRGRPLMIIGSYTHCRTASMAAWSKSGIDRSTLTDATRP